MFLRIHLHCDHGQLEISHSTVIILINSLITRFAILPLSTDRMMKSNLMHMAHK